MSDIIFPFNMQNLIEQAGTRMAFDEILRMDPNRQARMVYDRPVNISFELQEEVPPVMDTGVMFYPSPKEDAANLNQTTPISGIFHAKNRLFNYYPIF